MFGRRKIAMLVAEFLGAAVLSVAVYTIMARTTFPLFIGLAAGITLGVLTLTLGPVSGAHINPVVTLGLWTLRRIQTMQAVVYIAAQMVGGLAAWVLIKYFIGRDLDSLAGDTFEWKVFIAEAIGAAVFVFGVAAAHYQKLENGKAATVIGGSLLLGVLIASMASNALVNPTVAVAVQSWNWAYATGPLIGSVVGASLYGLLFYPTVGGSKSTTKKRKK